MFCKYPWNFTVGSNFVVVVQLLSHIRLCDPLDCCMLGFPVLLHLSEFAQTHVHWVSDAIQPSHALSSTFPPAFNLYQHPGLSNESVLHITWPKYWSFSFSISPSNENSGLISFRFDWLDLLVVQGTFKSAPMPHFKSINSLLLSFLYSPTLISIHDYWRNHKLCLYGPFFAK